MGGWAGKHGKWADGQARMVNRRMDGQGRQVRHLTVNRGTLCEQLGAS